MNRERLPSNSASSVEEIILGSSPPIRRLRALIQRAAPSSLPILIEGPTGAGKELVAQSIHLASSRRGRFVPFNVCAVAEGIFEDALFGHVRGAFTGALSDRAGYLEEAHQGTAFLDEIGGLALTAQAKLLRAIETGEFRPVGGRADRRSEFRLVAASNVSLSSLVDDGRFRADLAYRLGGLTIVVPPLSDRLEDVPLLAAHFLARADPTGGTTMSEGGLHALREHSWPGNVRELRHTVERAMVLSTTSLISRETVRAALAVAPRAVPQRQDFADRRLLEILEAVSWNVDEAARQMQVHRATIYRRLRRLQSSSPGLQQGSARLTDASVGRAIVAPRGATTCD